MHSNSSSPRFGDTRRAETISDGSTERGSLKNLLDARKARAQAARSEGLPSLRGLVDNDALTGLDKDRADVSLNLSLRYMQLRDTVIRDRQAVRKLREEHGRLQDSLKSVREKAKQKQVDRERLNAMKAGLFAITETMKRHNLESEEMKLGVIKKELSSVMEWNSHVAAMVAFLQAQQGPVIKQQASTPPVATKRRSKSPIRHWSP